VIPRVACLVVLLGCLAGALRAAEPAAYLADFPRAHATLETARVCILLDIYLAVTPAQRAQGLMHIRELGEFEGMLFSSEPARVSMWMKNTYVSLDMLFISDGRVAHIVADTTPLSETRIAPPHPVTDVLELNAGFARRHDVRAGDRFLLLPMP
jgi:uncharacterized protein